MTVGREACNHKVIEIGLDPCHFTVGDNVHNSVH